MDRIKEYTNRVSGFRVKFIDTLLLNIKQSNHLIDLEITLQIQPIGVYSFFSMAPTLFPQRRSSNSSNSFSFFSFDRLYSQHQQSSFSRHVLFSKTPSFTGFSFSFRVFFFLRNSKMPSKINKDRTTDNSQR